MGAQRLAEDTKYLERHRDQWRVRIRVPDNVRHLFDGKTYLRQALGTSNLRTANVLKGEHVARFKLRIAEAVAGVSPGATIWAEAKALRSRYSEATFEKQDDMLYEMVLRAEALEKSGQPDMATSFVGAATGRTIPIGDYLDDYIGDKSYRPKSEGDLKRAIGWLEDWLSRQQHPPTLEAVTQPLAGDFMRHLVQTRNLSAKNASKYISFIRGYWLWLEEQGHRPRNMSPWLGKLPKLKAPPRTQVLEPDGGKRSFTDDEVSKLLNGAPSRPYLRDLMLIAALSGMRIEECYLLRIQDTEDEVFNIRVGKTANAIRKVPIHSALEPTLKRLRKGKFPLDYLIDPTAEVLQNTDIRSQAASKAFGHYRRSLKIDERPNEKHQSNVDFHSFRRWFVGKARDALNAGAVGFSDWTVSEVVGHGVKGGNGLELTMKKYAGKSPLAALRACVEAVRLPTNAAQSGPVEN